MRDSFRQISRPVAGALAPEKNDYLTPQDIQIQTFILSEASL